MHVGEVFQSIRPKSQSLRIKTHLSIFNRYLFINIDAIFAHTHKITSACGCKKLFHAGQILYSQTNFQRDFSTGVDTQVSFTLWQWSIILIF